MAEKSPPPPPPPDEPTDETAPPPPPDKVAAEDEVRQPSSPAGLFDEQEGQILWRIMETLNTELIHCDPTNSLSEEDVKAIQVEVLERVFAVMSKERRSELEDDDRAYIRRRVSVLVQDYLPAPKLRFAQLDRVVSQGLHKACARVNQSVVRACHARTR